VPATGDLFATGDASTGGVHRNAVSFGLAAINGCQTDAWRSWLTKPQPHTHTQMPKRLSRQCKIVILERAPVSRWGKVQTQAKMKAHKRRERNEHGRPAFRQKTKSGGIAIAVAVFLSGV
jgi:hypothetical protein